MGWWAAVLIGQAAAGAGEPPAIITNPDWARRPSSAQLQAAYPLRAVRSGLGGGSARIQCVVAVNGTLTDCVAIEETPPGYGFGAAALSLTQQLVMRPQQRNGRPVGGATVTIPIRFSGVPGNVSSRRPPSVRDGGVIVGAQFTDAPSRAEVAAVAPAGVQGWASMRCDLDAEGRATTCAGLQEEPEDRGLLAAARQLARRFRVSRPSNPDINLSRSRVDVRVDFGGERPAYVQRPAWLRAPTGQEVQAALQGEARAASDRTAGAVADCAIGAGGVLSDCRAERATTPAAGAAVVALAGRFAVQPWREDGVPLIGARIRLPLRYVAD